MKKKKPGYGTFIAISYRFIIQFKIAGVIIFYCQQFEKIKKTNDDTLKPVNPNYYGKVTRVVLVIPNTVNIPRQKKNKGSVKEYFLTMD